MIHSAVVTLTRTLTNLPWRLLSIPVEGLQDDHTDLVEFAALDKDGMVDSLRLSCDAVMVDVLHEEVPVPPVPPHLSP